MKPSPVIVEFVRPSEALSPARAALANHLNAITDAQRAVDAAKAPLDRLASAEAAETSARHALEELGNRETAALTAWATTGGERPAMLTSERQQAAAALADAAATAEAARRAAGVTTEVGARNTKPLATMAGTGDLRKSASDMLAAIDPLVTKVAATTARVNGATKGSAEARIATEQASEVFSDVAAYAAIKLCQRNPKRAGLTATR